MNIIAVLIIIILVTLLVVVSSSSLFCYRESFANVNSARKWLKDHTDWFKTGLDNGRWCGIDRVYFITLPQRLENVKNINKQLNINDKSWYLKAIITDSIKPRELFDKKVAEKKFWNGTSQWSPGSKNHGRVACALSHLACMYNFLNDKSADTCVIFEDDLKIKGFLAEKNTEQFIKNVYEMNLDWDILYLGYCFEAGSKYIGKGVQKLGKPVCLHAYVLNKKGARKILNKLLPVSDSIDVVIKNMIKKGEINAYGPVTMNYRQNPTRFPTTIFNNKFAPPQYLLRNISLEEKFKRFSLRVKNAFANI